ncbi:MAG: transglutaminase-like cysteine peptidase [Proteobacteria bacterium]|nr:transglutaminase-like cysteine peptidase [Pseudomonadota bacterium]
MRAVLFLLAVILLGACQSLPDETTPMSLGEIALTPPGHTDFCQRYPADCARRDGVQQASLTPALWQELWRVHRAARAATRPVTDSAQYGRVEFWDYANGAGDCEDVALLSYRELISRGWAPTTLRMAVGVTEWGDRHAVLVAITNRGDFVLDSAYAQVMPWDRLPYSWIKRQSQRDDRVWQIVEAPPENRLIDGADTTPVAATRRHRAVDDLPW